MPLSAGTCLGAYEIVSPIGAGGMGEVYRAKDTKLGREVALKVLPASFASDPDRLMRFEREAKTLASLNHPNIAHIHGLEESHGIRALVMELVDGEDLSDRLRHGAMPLADALPIARQIAEALEAAHEAGIIHRDLKPANIKVREDGSVKVLDFGLAKAMSPGGPADGTVGGVANSPTMTSPALTAMGFILGTAAYMSPEQARGRGVDARTDIWAFGCVLFEMLTGRPPFEGDNVTDILGAIVHKDPDWSLLPAAVPESLRHLLDRCLAKNQKQRLHSSADVRLEIEGLIARPRSPAGGATAAAPGLTRMAMRERVAWGLAAVAVAAAATLLLWRSPPAAGGPASFRLSMLPAEGGEVGVPVISPDGQRVAYSARGADGMPTVWVRDLAQSTPRSLPGTEEGNRVFWSPDSKRLGFIVGTTMKQISADGGPVREIARNVRAGASWGATDVIVYADTGGQINRVDASGGQGVAVTTLQGPDWEHVSPSMLPDGRHFVFTAKHWAGLAEAGSQGIYLGSIDDPTGTRQLLSDLSSAVYASPGYLVFARDGHVMAAPFDAAAGHVTGDPVALGEDVAVDDIYYLAGLSAARHGTLAIRLPPAPAISAAVSGGTFDADLTFFRRDGSLASRIGSVQLITFRMALSPSGRSVIAQVHDARTSAADLWQVDVETGARTPVTAMRTSGGWVGSPVWSPDGTRLAYACQLPGILDDVCVRDMRSGVVTTVVQSKTIWEHPLDWSSDGQYMLVAYDPYTESSRAEMRVWSARTNALTPYVTSSRQGVFSPDVRFVAFTSQESGRNEVMVTTFPERGQTWPLTTDGGNVLSWRDDGREILVATIAGHIVAYPVSTTGGTFSSGTPQVLLRNVGFDALFARATRDHSRILVRVPKDADKDHGEIRLLFGWARGR